jgi:hypothetical protein
MVRESWAYYAGHDEIDVACEERSTAFPIAPHNKDTEHHVQEEVQSPRYPQEAEEVRSDEAQRPQLARPSSRVSQAIMAALATHGQHARNFVGAYTSRHRNRTTTRLPHRR